MKTRVTILVLLLMPLAWVGITVYSVEDLNRSIKQAGPMIVMHQGDQKPLSDVLREAAGEQLTPWEYWFLQLPSAARWGLLYFIWGVVGGVIQRCRSFVNPTPEPHGSFGAAVLLFLAGAAGALVVLALYLPAGLFARLFGFAQDLPADRHVLLTQLQLLPVAAGMYADNFLSRLKIFAGGG